MKAMLNRNVEDEVSSIHTVENPLDRYSKNKSSDHDS
jgi:hypothetical protein